MLGINLSSSDNTVNCKEKCSSPSKLYLNGESKVPTNLPAMR